MRRGNQVLSKIRPQVVQVCRVWCLVDVKSFCNPSMGNVKMSSSVLVSPYMFANISCTIMDRYGNTNTGTLVVQRCIGTEAKLYDCWYFSVDSRLCTSDVALECKQGECSIICENGGIRTTDCTCDCADGFSGMNCSSE